MFAVRCVVMFVKNAAGTDLKESSVPAFIGCVTA